MASRGVNLLNRAFDHLAELIATATVAGGYHNDIPSSKIYHQSQPINTRTVPPNIYIYFDGFEPVNDGQFASGFAGRYQIDIFYTIIGEVEVGKESNTLRTVLVNLVQDIIKVLRSDFHLSAISTANSDANFTLDHHEITEVDTSEGFAFPKGLFELRGVMTFANVSLDDL